MSSKLERAALWALVAILAVATVLGWQRQQRLEEIARQPAEQPGRALLTDLTRQVGDLEEQLEQLTATTRTTLDELAAARGDPAASLAPAGYNGPAGERAAGVAVDSRSSIEPQAALKDEFLRLLGPMVSPTGGSELGAEQMQRFWELARTPVLGELLTELESAVQEHPEDPELRMELADAYVAKLLSVPAGPERGIWGQRAEEQWTTVAESDPQHWESHFKIANNLSYYPDFLGRTNDAIRWFEKTRDIQLARRPEPAHTTTYVKLARLYQKQGQMQQARETLQLGAERHPDDEAIASALAAVPAIDDDSSAGQDR